MTDQSDPSGFDRTEEDDHDLLTFGEAGLRIAEAIEDMKTAIAHAKSPSEAEALRLRLDQLTTAAARNSRQPITDETFERFFGYSGTARRNTSWK
jgi:hypothetical protein